jgi:hypothetical protein
MKQLIALIGILLLLFLYLFMFNDRGNKIEYFNEEVCGWCKSSQGIPGAVGPKGDPGPSGQAGPQGPSGNTWKSMKTFVEKFFKSKSGSNLLDAAVDKAVKDAMEKEEETTQ